MGTRRPKGLGNLDVEASSVDQMKDRPTSSIKRDGLFGKVGRRYLPAASFQYFLGSSVTM